MARADRRPIRQLLTASGEASWWGPNAEAVLPTRTQQVPHKVPSRGGSLATPLTIAGIAGSCGGGMLLLPLVFLVHRIGHPPAAGLDWAKPWLTLHGWIGSVLASGAGATLMTCLALSIVFEIGLDEVERVVIFRSWRGRLAVRVEDVRSIRAGAWFDPGRGQLTVEHEGGKLTPRNEFADFRGFLVDLRTLNPSVEIRGL